MSADIRFSTAMMVAGRTVDPGAVRMLEAKGAIHKHNDVP